MKNVINIKEDSLADKVGETIFGNVKYKIKEWIDVKRQLRFIDSFKFMSTALGNLVKNLDKNEEEKQLLLRKGIFPYDWFDSLEKLEETKLAEKEKFYSKLDDKNVTDEGYDHAQKVWEKFKMKNIKDNHDLYLKTDVLLLADVLESFRKVCKENYELDPAWYYTSPGLARDAMLKMTEVKLELLSDPEIYLMIEKGIRGVVSMVKKKICKSK